MNISKILVENGDPNDILSIIFYFLIIFLLLQIKKF